MIHFCICGAREGNLTSDGTVYVTIFGACELKRPTLARQIIERRRRAASGLPHDKPFFITICGATELKCPTLAEEFLDMSQAIRDGSLSLEELDAAAAQLDTTDESEYGSFTLCGAFGARELPSENEEVDGLATNRHFGHIPEPAGRTLELGVGQHGSHRSAVVRRALTAANLATV